MKIKLLLLFVVCSAILSACKLYSFSGYSLDPDVKTATVSQFQNNAEIVNPALSQIISESLRDKLISELDFEILNGGNSDISFSGSIISYSVDPVSFTGDDQAAQNRLTVTLRVKYDNVKHDDQSWEQNFSRFTDFDISQNFADIEESLVDEINGQLIDDIFNKAFVNW